MTEVMHACSNHFKKNDHGTLAQIQLVSLQQFPQPGEILPLLHG